MKKTKKNEKTMMIVTEYEDLLEMENELKKKLKNISQKRASLEAQIMDMIESGVETGYDIKITEGRVCPKYQAIAFMLSSMKEKEVFSLLKRGLVEEPSKEWLDKIKQLWKDKFGVKLSKKLVKK